MKRQWQKGESNLDGILIIAVLIIIFLIAPKGDSGSGGSSWSLVPGTTITSSGSETSSTVRSDESRSVHPTLSQSISIGSGNAPYAYQSYEEYVVVENRSREAVDITDWQLRNGKDKRAYYQGGALQRFSADVAVIPQAALFLNPSGNNIFQDVILEDNERAILTTGSVGVQSPYKIVSFKENMCTGYLEASSDYAFTPPLAQNCPRPSEEKGLENLDTKCRDFVKYLSSCHMPSFGGKDRDGRPCPECVNGEILSSSCVTFIKERFNYRGCVANHASNPNFYGKTWRVFLGRGWEMWAKDYETIELFNQFGQLVDFENY